MTSLPFRLHHIGVSVRDLDATIAWYTETLDFVLESTYDIPALPARAAFVRHGDVRVELFEAVGAVPAPGGAHDLRVYGPKHMALGVDDLHSVREVLRARGVEFVTEIATVPGTDRDLYAFFHDNNGLWIELFETHTP